MPYLTETDIDGGLWELGILVPIKNPCMERFEQHFELYNDVAVGANKIDIEEIGDRILSHALIFIGPSSDPTRDSNGDFLYKGKYEVFKIRWVIDYKDPNEIWIKDRISEIATLTQYSYLKGDPVTIRPISESWNFIKTTDFSDLYCVNNMKTQYDLRYSRGDAIDDYRGYSQIVNIIDSTNVYDAGIIQRLNQESKNAIVAVNGKNVRISSWLKCLFEEVEAVVSNPIDENIAGPQLDDIDEGYGWINNEAWDRIDERPTDEAGAGRTVAPSIRLSLYNDAQEISPSVTYTETTGDLSTNTQNIMLYDVVQVLDRTLTGRIAVYARFTSSPAIHEMALAIGNIIMEHCVGTSKEDNGYYEVDMNPAIDVTLKNRKGKDITRDLLGRGYNETNADPTMRYGISANWKNKTPAFIEDMQLFEEWNKKGYPIILRPKMPGKLPNLLLCNMDINNIEPIEGYSGNERFNISIEFKEITN